MMRLVFMVRTFPGRSTPPGLGRRAGTIAPLPSKRGRNRQFAGRCGRAIALQRRFDRGGAVLSHPSHQNAPERRLRVPWGIPEANPKVLSLHERILTPKQRSWLVATAAGARKCAGRCPKGDGEWCSLVIVGLFALTPSGASRNSRQAQIRLTQHGCQPLGFLVLLGLLGFMLG